MLASSHLSIHARKLYLASLFRVFDELDAVSDEANYETTGALGKDRNTGVMYNGVLLKVALIHAPNA